MSLLGSVLQVVMFEVLREAAKNVDDPGRLEFIYVTVYRFCRDNREVCQGAQKVVKAVDKAITDALGQE